jgi:hypothetical protein
MNKEGLHRVLFLREFKIEIWVNNFKPHIMEKEKLKKTIAFRVKTKHYQIIQELCRNEKNISVFLRNNIIQSLENIIK